MNVSLMICDKNKGLKLKTFAEECIMLCSYGDSQIGVKGD